MKCQTDKSHYGGRSSVGRASACGAEGRRFKPGRSPHLKATLIGVRGCGGTGRRARFRF